MTLFLIGLSVAVIAFLITGMVLLFSYLSGAIIRKFKKKSTDFQIEKNALMKTLLEAIEQSTISSLYINSNIVCYNFSFIDHATTTTTKRKYSGEVVSSSTTHKYTCQLTNKNVMDFNLLGYQEIRPLVLQHYVSELLEHVNALPNVKKVTKYQNLTFTPPTLFISNGQYGKQPNSWEKMYLFEYHHLGPKVQIPNGAKKIG